MTNNHQVVSRNERIRERSRQYTMGGQWKHESAAAQDVDRTWDGRERTMKDARKKERRAMTKHMTGDTHH